jgi:hypothetical protein
MTAPSLSTVPFQDKPRPIPLSSPIPSGAPAVRAIARLAAEVDHLHELRGLIRQAQETERQITRELLAVMTAQALGAVQGTQAVAIREARTSLQVDATRFLEAAGARAPEALSVSVTAARRLLGEATLEAISETVTTPVLRVELFPCDAGREG